LLHVVVRLAEFKCNDPFLFNDLIKPVEFKNSLLELKCAVNCFILFSNQNQQRIQRGVPWCFDSKAIGLDNPWCSVVSRGVQVSLGRKYFLFCLQPWCSMVFPWCPVVFRSL
jgi:hypothetical protein